MTYYFTAKKKYQTLLTEQWKQLYTISAKLEAVTVLFVSAGIAKFAILFNVLNLIPSISFDKNNNLYCPAIIQK